MVESETVKYVYHLDSSVLTNHLPKFLEGLRMKCVSQSLHPKPIGEGGAHLHE